MRRGPGTLPLVGRGFLVGGFREARHPCDEVPNERLVYMTRDEVVKRCRHLSPVDEEMVVVWIDMDLDIGRIRKRSLPAREIVFNGDLVVPTTLGNENWATEPRCLARRFE